MHLLQKKSVKEEQRNKKRDETCRIQKQNGKCKSTHINNSIKSEWIEQDNQKIEDQIGFFKNDSTICCLQ